MTEPDPRPKRPQSSHFQFGLGTLLIVTLVASLVAATYGGLIQGGQRRPLFIVLGLLGPVGLVILLSALSQVARRRSGRR